MITLLGDIHGNWRMMDAAIKRLSEGDTLIQVGDLGLGFRKNDEKTMALLGEHAQNKGVQVLAIRGNHDDPSFFDGRQYGNGSLTLLNDYTSLSIEGKKFLFVGGGISIDRIYRTVNVDYWANESFKLSPKRLVLKENHDILITHVAGNNICTDLAINCPNKLDNSDVALNKDLKDERNKIDKLLKIVRPKLWFFGHYHFRAQGSVDDCEWTCLDINEQRMISL